MPKDKEMQRNCGMGDQLGEEAWVILQRGLLIFQIIVCLVGASFAQTNIHKRDKSRPSQPSLAAGRRVFESSCAPCHGLNGKGGERAPDIATRPEVIRLSDNETLKLVQGGIPQKGMPPFASLGSARLSGVLNYLRLLQGKDRATGITVNVQQGKEIFTGKAGCAECHTVHGIGGFLGPDLSDFGVNHSASEIRSMILSADSRPAAHKGFVTATNNGQKISGVVRNEDNFTLQLQAVDGTFHMLDKSGLSQLTFDSAPVMPNDYGAKLSKAELEKLVGYVLSAAGSMR